MISKKQFEKLISELNQESVALIAVSKTYTPEEMSVLQSWGQRDFGENRIEEINRKTPLLESPLRWHLIGPLQSKKIKLLGKNIHLFHAVDRMKVLQKLDDHMKTLDHVQDVLIQVHIAREESKHGFQPQEVRQLFEQKLDLDHRHVRIRGLMGMATMTTEAGIVRSEFDGLKRLFDQVKATQADHFDTLSMGMSGDFRMAIDSGSTMVRIGTMLFGPRSYEV